jgi:uncharacterized protein YacL
VETITRITQVPYSLGVYVYLSHHSDPASPLLPLSHTMNRHRGAYAMWLAVLVAILVTIAVDSVVIFLSTTAPSRESTVIVSDSLITFVSLFLQVLRIWTINPVNNRSFPYIKPLLVCVFVIALALSVTFTTLFALRHHTFYSLVTQLTCFFHATLVEVCIYFFSYGFTSLNTHPYRALPGFGTWSTPTKQGSRIVWCYTFRWVSRLYFP